MSAILTISVPDPVIERLRVRAAERGSTPEQVADDDVVQATLPPGYGRLRRLVGTWSSDVTDASVRTDAYITDTLLDHSLDQPHG